MIRFISIVETTKYYLSEVILGSISELFQFWYAFWNTCSKPEGNEHVSFINRTIMKKLMIVGMLFASMGLFAQEAPSKNKAHVCEKKCNKMPKAPVGQMRERQLKDHSANGQAIRPGKIVQHKQHAQTTHRIEMQDRRLKLKENR